MSNPLAAAPVVPDVDAAVKLTLDLDDPTQVTVASVAVSGRPTPHPFPGGEGRHTTAWAVFTDTVRRRMVGQEVAAAVHRLTLLVASEHGRGTVGLSQARAARRTAAHQRATAALGQAGAAVAQLVAAPVANRSATAGTVIIHLQTAIGAYLTMRNLAPLAGGFLGANQAPGAGEGAALLVCREFESGTPYPAAVVADAVWALLDVDTLVWALDATQATADALPGRSPGAEDTVCAIVLRHLTEISEAYPLCYAHSNLHVKANLQLRIRRRQALSAFLVPAAMALPVANPAAGAAPVGWATSAGVGICPVSLVLDDGLLTITEVRVPSRGKTLLATQGHHMTAHSAVVAAVSRCVVGKPLNVACASLIALADDVVNLPTFPPGNVPTVQNNGDPKNRFAFAWEMFGIVLAAARQATPGMTAVAIQDLASVYLVLRNVLPLAAVNHGAVPGGHSEGITKKSLNTAEAATGAPNAALARTDLWDMFDCAMLTPIVDAGVDLVTLTDLAPGATVNAVNRVAQVIVVHLKTVQVAWPVCCTVAGMLSQASIVDMLATMHLNLDQTALLTAIGALTGPLPAGNHVAFTRRLGEERTDPSVQAQHMTDVDTDIAVADRDEVTGAEVRRLADRRVGKRTKDDEFIVDDRDTKKAKTKAKTGGRKRARDEESDDTYEEGDGDSESDSN
jgi:hypothetical protein